MNKNDPPTTLPKCLQIRVLNDLQNEGVCT